MTMWVSCRLWLLLLLPQHVLGRRLQAPPSAVNTNVTQAQLEQTTLSPEVEQAILTQGDFFIPSSYEATDDLGRPNCGISVNASFSTCNQLISRSNNSTCDCYNFCSGQLAGCYNFGEKPTEFDCEIQDLVLGCRRNFTPPAYNETGPEPCPVGYMCGRTSQQLCSVIRSIPVAAGLGDVHAGMYCP